MTDQPILVAVNNRVLRFPGVLLFLLLLLTPISSWAQGSSSAGQPAPQADGSGGPPTPTICGSVCEEDNPAPTVQLTAPANGSTANAPATIMLAASASDDSRVEFVRFFSNGVDIGGDSTYPYSFTYSGLAPGSYSFTAMATDDLGASGFSVARTVTVTIPPNNAPVAALTAPIGGSTAKAPASFLLIATASDGDGYVTKVEFKSGTTLLCTDTVPPYSCAYTGVAAGSYALTAIATDNWGVTKASAASTVSVTGVMPAAVSETRAYVYDELQRLCKTINPESGASVIEYDAAGNILWTADGTTLTGPTCDRASVTEGQKSRRIYDAMNRVTRVSTPGGTADITSAYYADGLVSTLTAANPGSNNVSTSYTYNKRRLLTGETSTNGATLFSLGYGYNANGHLGSTTYPDGQTVGYSPDALGRATRVAVAGGATYASGISYAPGGAIIGFGYGNGIVHSLTQNARRLPARSRDALGLTAVLDDSYGFDANGNVTDITDQAQNGLTTRVMGYDKLDRLAAVASPGQWGTATYGYDALDNLVIADQGTRKYRYNYDATTRRLGTIKSPAGATLFTLGYDVQGNTISKNSQKLVFDSANRLNQVTGQQVYRYDGQGRRVQTTDADGKTTFWIYSQSGQVLYTSEARRSRNLSYIYLGNTQVATRAVAWGTGTTTVSYQHTDALGSPVAESNNAGVVTKRNSYAPYGEAYAPTSIDGTGYTGHVMDQATGLTYMQQRYYWPEGGRFLSADPMASDMDNGWNFNRYSYAANNPYKYTDPDGRIIDTILDVGFIAYDVYVLASEGATAANLAALGADGVGLLIPGATGLGAAVRAGSRAESAAKAARLAENAASGVRREKQVTQALSAANPGAKVQRERMLLDANGKKVLDPKTGKGRRVDQVVIKDGLAKSYETTSLTANKVGQLDKEARIRASGGTYIRDRESRELVPVEGLSILIRVE